MLFYISIRERKVRFRYRFSVITPVDYGKPQKVRAEIEGKRITENPPDTPPFQNLPIGVSIMINDPCALAVAQRYGLAVCRREPTIGFLCEN